MQFITKQIAASRNVLYTIRQTIVKSYADAYIVKTKSGMFLFSDTTEYIF